MTMSVDQAQRQFEAAQAILEEARAAERFEAQFPAVDEIFLVISREASFDQFVSYAEAGIPLASFGTAGEAQEYADGLTPTPGSFILVEPLAFRAKSD